MPKKNTRCTACKTIYKHEWYIKHFAESSARGKKYYDTHKAKLLALNKLWKINNKDRYDAMTKKYCEENKETIYNNNREYRLANKETITEKQQLWATRNRAKRNESSKRWSAKNKTLKAEIARKWNNDNRDKVNGYAKKKRDTPKGRLNANITRYIGHTLKNGSKRRRHWEFIVGFTIDQLKNHLEKQFLPGMTWENYGRHGWHVDHIIPIEVFNFEFPEDIDFGRCWTLSNLQPLWEPDNIRKSDKLDRPFQPALTIMGNNIQQNIRRNYNENRRLG